MRPDVPTHPYGRRRPPVPDQSAVEGYLETRRRGYHTTPVPPELRLQQAGWSVRQVWVAERAGQTIRGPSLDYVAGEAYRREDLAVEKRARQAERSRVEHTLKALRDHADALEEGWETYKAHRGVPTEKVLKAEGKRSHSKAMKGLGNHQKALQGIHETLEKLKDDPPWNVTRTRGLSWRAHGLGQRLPSAPKE
jgi:hypothetical protein